MARLPRLVLPGYPMYASVRGHQGQAIFLDDADRRTYLEWLRDAAREHELAIHAYVLTDNQAQILATPKHSQSLAKVMQSLGRRYAHYSHQRYQTTGTLWEGRFRSCLIEAEPYFIQAQQFIEQTPVVQHLVQKPGDWAWSTANHHMGQETIPWISDHPQYWALGNTPFERQRAWGALLADHLSSSHLDKVSKHFNYGWPLLSESLITTLGTQLNRPMAIRKAGRPRKQSSAA